MSAKGQLVVFEGPDGVGKSTLVAKTEAYLLDRGVEFQSMSFPGKDPHTLGWVVNQIHHEPRKFQIVGLSPLSLQALHIAAHLDQIETRILPSLAQGVSVILDRFWWSTWVYGRAANVNTDVLDGLIDAEKTAWAGIKPEMVFLVNRATALRPEHTHEDFSRLTMLYRELAAEESLQYPVTAISTDDTDQCFPSVLSTLSLLIGK